MWYIGGVILLWIANSTTFALAQARRVSTIHPIHGSPDLNDQSRVLVPWRALDIFIENTNQYYLIRASSDPENLLPY